MISQHKYRLQSVLSTQTPVSCCRHCNHVSHFLPNLRVHYVHKDQLSHYTMSGIYRPTMGCRVLFSHL